VDRKTAGLDKYVRPNPSHQFLLADQLTWAFEQHGEDFQSAPSEGHWLVPFQQKKLSREQAKRSERNFGWRGVGGFGSLREEWLVRIRTLGCASLVSSRFGMKLS